MKEIWKDIEGYEGIYGVSTLGRVRSKKENIILSTHVNNKGYERLTLSKNGNQRTINVHRLVAETFLGYKEGYEVHHINGVKNDNRLENLEWVTHKENMLKNRTDTSDMSDRAKEMYNLRTQKGWTQAELGEKIGKGKTTIWKMENGRQPIDKTTALAVRQVMKLSNTN